MATCLYCNKFVDPGKRGTKKLHGERTDKESCNSKYQIQEGYKRVKTKTKATQNRDEDLKKKGYVPRYNFNDSFGV